MLIYMFVAWLTMTSLWYKNYLPHIIMVQVLNSLAEVYLGCIVYRIYTMEQATKVSKSPVRMIYLCTSDSLLLLKVF